MKFQNIHNLKRNIYLFCRDDSGRPIIRIDKTFFPYCYELSPTGEYITYDGKKVKKMFYSEPSEVAKHRSGASYEGDILFTKRYIIDKINIFEKCPIKYLFLDIEVQSNVLPKPGEAKSPISCITIYNSLSNSVHTWFLPDYESETKLIDDFIDYVYKEQPDIILSWNVRFDYNYLYNRIKDFAKRISPIHQARYSGQLEEKMLYPAGISIVDYLSLFRKVFMREPTYALDFIAQKYLDDKSWGKTDFSVISKEIKEKNINDIHRMVKLEKRFNIISYFDELRRLTRCLWEDLYHNSRLIEMLIFREAKSQRIILPTKTARADGWIAESFQGALRDVENPGVYKDVGKFDLASAYPSMIVNFCLDTQNIVLEGMSRCSNEVIINNIYFHQNPNALLPSIVKKILVTKDAIKKQKKEHPDNKDLATKYDAIKAIVNSTFGVMGNEYFRLYDNRVASSITFLVRDLLMYVKDEIEKEGYKVLYYDTDSLFINTKENIQDKLNELIQKWAKSFGKESIDLKFEYEGYFTNILLLGKCHYYGYIEGKKDPEIKGIEIKRSSSSKYEALFQQDLIDRILKGDDKATVLQWIKTECERIKTVPIELIGFPCKIANDSYKNEPIFVRAYQNTKLLNKDFKVDNHELFFYIFVESKGSNNGKPIDVLAFNAYYKPVMNINWDEMIRRSILTKTDTIFEVLNWGSVKSALSNQISLF